MNINLYLYLFLIGLFFFLSSPFLTAQIFIEQSEAIGIRHWVGHSRLMGGGAAFFDYDLDGDEDLYLTGGLDMDHLYENNGDGTFTRKGNTGLEVTLLFNTMAVSTGDVDNDGYREIFVSTWEKGSNTYGRNLFFKNNGNGSFTEMTEEAGLHLEVLSMGATFIDFDMDGFLDLYVLNHIKEPIFTHDSLGVLDGYAHECFPNHFYKNNGDFTFTNVTEELGLAQTGCSLAAIGTDYDLDNDLDLYIANDFGEYVVPNEMMQNNFPDLSFEDVSATSGADVGLFGMGIAAGDFDQDLDIDYYITNIGRNILIENRGVKGFVDITTEAGVENTYSAEEGLFTTGWGTAFLDIDNDSWQDLFVANGRIPAAHFNPTGENDPNKLYLNNRDQTFTDISAEAGIEDMRMGRGMAYSDYDQDGDLDIIVAVLDGWESDSHSKFYINQNETNGNNWVQFKLKGVQCNRDAYGSKVWLYANDKIFLRELYSGSASFASQSSSVLHFGLENRTSIDSVHIDWLGGKRQVLYNLAINQRHEVEEEVEVVHTENTPLNTLTPNIFPNPFIEEFNIQLSHAEMQEVELTVVDVFGKQQAQQLVKVEKNASISSTILGDCFKAKGIYYLTIKAKKGVWCKKVIKL